MMGRYPNENINREHESVFIAIHHKTGKMFGGKAKGTHIGYSKLRDLKAAMTYANVRHDNFVFTKLTFKDLVPILTTIDAGYCTKGDEN